MSLIDSQLYRNLQLGTAYEGLIPAYNHTDFPFDKTSDNSNTYDTLKFMSVWAYKYAHQMKKVAPLLKGVTLQETVNKIYAFLYSHFQYKLDGETQNLMSPSAAWHFRKTGFDCKTYSILASTILQNLGIPHAFRMVQQAGIMPGEWSHVYVVVPNGNQELIIDATTHTNKQVSYTQKHDYTMKHRGLASPYVGALGCACQGTPITKSGLGSPAVLNNTIANFHVFLNELEKQGFSRQVTDRMLQLVKWNVSNGIDPNMGEILQKALLPQSALGAILPVSSITPVGYTVPLPTASLPSPTTIASYGTVPTSTFSAIKTQAVSAGTSALSNLSVGGISVTSAMSAAVGDPMAIAGIAMTLLKKVIPIDKTFGAVFANGFDLSCWGSTLTPTQTKLWAEKDIPAVYAATLGKGLSEANLHLFIDAMNWVKAQADSWGAKMQSCSKKALQQYGEAAIKAKIEVLTKTQEVVKLTPISSVTTGAKLPFTFSHANFNVYDKTYPSERFVISLLPGVPQQSTTSVATVDANGNTIVTTTPKASSSTTPILLGAGLLALKFLL